MATLKKVMTVFDFGSQTKHIIGCVFAVFCLTVFTAEGAVPPKRIFNETDAHRTERMSWWLHDRFGMFIHFGLYAVPARHEWVMSYEAIDADTYSKRYFPRFNPDLYDAKQWAKAAKAAGMKYAVLTML